ncbi:D-alanyl-D-alanine carboxypeptidase family protein [Alkalihalobacterium chitinilyticum]|uniref:D-alanyl-D-alanine carboxypeptidase n=1 Tax=Alkalihalobacterium chitinilyticum TaxID=2980103 RepID=A0ABT5VD04_9BACI|nr:D-alanyl-D-alanine carboxypeptidase family protein [Alkalihalobacterium chitinilyticum]MDE5412617.1 D-alanyl-D-alanine carboxypeptidase [Alkalihalobacterium chitinilyticum]
MLRKISGVLILYISLYLLGNGTVNASVKVDFSEDLFSEAVILIDGKSGKVLYEKNSEQQMYPASITKIITGILAIEQADLSDTVTISKNAREVIGTRVYLLEGEEVELKKLVQGLLISSGNDAGLAIAEHISENEMNFARKMNQFVREKVGVDNTNFTNPHGLFDEEHYTTAYDMAKIAKYAMKNDTFREIVSTKELPWIGEGWETTIYNHNRMLWNYEGATGIKNGYVQKSGYTLVTSVQQGETELIAVTLNAPSSKHAYRDMHRLFDYGFDNFDTKLIAKDQVFQDPFGSKYTLADDLYVTVKKGDALFLDVSIYGYLKVVGKNNQLVGIRGLQRMEEQVAKRTPEFLASIERR